MSMKRWIAINHADGTQKVFFQVNAQPRCFDMSSAELTEEVNNKVQACQNEIDMWEDLLEAQKEWIDAKKSS